MFRIEANELYEEQAIDMLYAAFADADSFLYSPIDDKTVYAIKKIWLDLLYNLNEMRASLIYEDQFEKFVVKGFDIDISTSFEGKIEIRALKE